MRRPHPDRFHADRPQLHRPLHHSRLHRRRPATLLLPALLAALLPFAACSPAEEETATAPAPEPVRIESEDLALAVAIPPGSPFEPLDAPAGEIRLRFPATSEFSEGTVTLTAQPEQDYGVNLVDAVNDRKAELEAMPDGQFLGQVELGHEVLGTAYSTRGRYVDDAGNEVEEIRIFAVHPAANRLVQMTYRYQPAPGQTEARMMDQAFEALGYVEPLATPPAEPQATSETP